MKSEAARLEEELMTARMSEVDAQAEMKEARLKVMELETQVRACDSPLNFPNSPSNFALSFFFFFNFSRTK